MISGLYKIAFFSPKTLEVEGTLNKNIVQSRHFFLLNIEINKRVPFFLSLSVFVVISTAEQIPLWAGYCLKDLSSKDNEEFQKKK